MLATNSEYFFKNTLCRKPRGKKPAWQTEATLQPLHGPFSCLWGWEGGAAGLGCGRCSAGSPRNATSLLVTRGPCRLGKQRQEGGLESRGSGGGEERTEVRGGGFPGEQKWRDVCKGKCGSPACANQGRPSRPLGARILHPGEREKPSQVRG